MAVDFCEVANGYVAELRARGPEIDTQRALPQDLADRLAADGFYRLCTPIELGGVGFALEEQEQEEQQGAWGDEEEEEYDEMEIH